MGQPPQNKHQWPYSPFHNTTKSSHNNDSSNTKKNRYYEDVLVEQVPFWCEDLSASIPPPYQ